MKTNDSEKVKFDACVGDISLLLENASTIFQMIEREHVKQNKFTGSQSFLMIQLLESGVMSVKCTVAGCFLQHWQARFI